MAQKKGKTGNPNGRPRGRQNKVTVTMKVWIQGLVSDNLEQLKKDLGALDPRDRWNIVEKLMGYITPKLQSLDTQEQIRLEYLELETLLKKAPDEAVQRIAYKVLELRELSEQK